MTDARETAAAPPPDAGGGPSARAAPHRPVLPALAVGTWLVAGLLVLVHALLVRQLQVAVGGFESARDLLLSPVPAWILDQLGAVRPDALERGERARLVVSALLHANGLHLLMNTVALLALGRPFERIFGTLGLLGSLAAGALGGSIAAAALGAPLSVGASGAIFAIAGALVTGLRGPGLLPDVARSMRLRMLVFIALLIGGGLAWNETLAPKTGVWVSNAGHAGGALAGAFLGLVLAPRMVAAPVRRGLGFAVSAGLVTGALALGASGTPRIPTEPRADWLGDVMELEPRDLPAFGLTLSVPSTWRTLREESGYVSFGPEPGAPYIQILEQPAGDARGPVAVPEQIVYQLEHDNPGLIAAPLERHRLVGREVFEIEVQYEREGRRTQQVRYLVLEKRRALHLVFLGEPPLARRVADVVYPTLVLTEGPEEDR